MHFEPSVSWNYLNASHGLISKKRGREYMNINTKPNFGENEARKPGE